MCGIVGIWHKQTNRPVSEGMLIAMRDTMTHRGPDDAGVYVKNSLGLGHRRLSIIDTSSGGHQPMVSQDGRYALVFNGEIYNYADLKKDLLSDIAFTSSSDTEVLLQLLIRFEESILPKLRGMFALAFWDNQDKILFLANDPFGKKPLFYTEQDGTFLFASEPRALASYGAVSLQLDEKSLPAYLLHEYLPAPQTGFLNVKRLEMGRCATVTAHNMSIKTWWLPSFAPKKTISEPQAIRELDTLMAQSVERRLVADVPVGIFLSGGLDSTTILWYMKKLGARDIHSCSASFSDPSFDESLYIRDVVRSFAPIHHNLHFGIPEFLDIMQTLPARMDIPLADASLLPTLAVSLLAKKHMSVVLSGDGSDEIFGGYGTFGAAEIAEFLKFVPPALWRAFDGLSSYLPVSHRYFSWDFKIKSFLRGASYPLWKRNQLWLGSFSPSEAKMILRPKLENFDQHVWQAVAQLGVRPLNGSVFDAVSQATIFHYLQNDILVKLDRATMLASLEARTPFLDVDLAEFVMRLPVRLKRNKYLLKRLMRGRIADVIIDRPKKGFGIPLGRWFNGPLNEWLHATLSEERVDKAGIFVWPVVKKIVREHEQGKADHRKKIWTMIVLQLWHEHWCQVEQSTISNR